MNNNIIERARVRFEELSGIMQAAERVKDEWAQLQAFLSMAEQVSERLSPVSKNGHEASLTTEHVTPNGHAGNFQLQIPVFDGRLTIPERAEQILRRSGPLHVKELFKQMRSSGWKATGDDAKDQKNLGASLWTRKQRFVNTGGNVWDLVARQKVAETRRN